MKDNKIDIMCNKIGNMKTLCRGTEGNSEVLQYVDVMRTLEKGLEQLQYDLEILRKCTIDNPNFKWSDNLSK